jgi:hypothetical protein
LAGLQLGDTGLDIPDMTLALRVAIFKRRDLRLKPLPALLELSQPPFALIQLRLQCAATQRNCLSFSLSSLE